MMLDNSSMHLVQQYKRKGDIFPAARLLIFKMPAPTRESRGLIKFPSSPVTCITTVSSHGEAMRTVEPNKTELATQPRCERQ